MESIEFIIEAQDVLLDEMKSIVGGTADETVNPCSPGGQVYYCTGDGVKSKDLQMSII